MQLLPRIVSLSTPNLSGWKDLHKLLTPGMPVVPDIPTLIRLTWLWVAKWRSEAQHQRRPCFPLTITTVHHDVQATARCSIVQVSYAQARLYVVALATETSGSSCKVTFSCFDEHIGWGWGRWWRFVFEEEEAKVEYENKLCCFLDL
jgi:hypothetical protein